MPEPIKLTPLEELMLKREIREAEEFEQRQGSLKAQALHFAEKLKNKLQREQRGTDKEIKHQSRCNHHKGNGCYKKSPVPEFNLYAHQLPSGRFFIKCLAGCAMRWDQGDTREMLQNYHGKRVKNHTGFSFEDMWAKLPHDSVSRSEVSMLGVGTEAPANAA